VGQFRFVDPRRSAQFGGMTTEFALIGFGEAGSTFASAGQWGGRAFAYDIAPDRRAAMIECGVRPAANAAEALVGAPLVLSLVTADGALAATRDYAPLLNSGTIWCDMNSVAPDTKREAAIAIEAAGGRYVDVAILAPVSPGGMNVPLLLAGKAAAEAETWLRDAGFTNLRIAGDEIGRASEIKMIRSVMVKGIEALTAEMMAAAEAAGVVPEVLASLDASERQIGWTERAAYHLERMRAHGLRRAAEMEEVARTLRSLGVEPVMTEGTVRRHRALGLEGKESKA
jgi:3-hydroxyisobutyrate dehydrogenase-like beta-hydroxyacid dehydrogenase